MDAGNSIRDTMTDVPPDTTYTIIMSATVSSVGPTMSTTFSITFVDPCSSTVPSYEWGNLSSPALYGIKDPALVDYAIMSDSVSTSHPP